MSATLIQSLGCLLATQLTSVPVPCGTFFFSGDFRSIALHPLQVCISSRLTCLHSQSIVDKTLLPFLTQAWSPIPLRQRCGTGLAPSAPTCVVAIDTQLSQYGDTQHEVHLSRTEEVQILRRSPGTEANIHSCWTTPIHDSREWRPGENTNEEQALFFQQAACTGGRPTRRSYDRGWINTG